VRGALSCLRFSDDGFDDRCDAKLFFENDGLVLLVAGHEEHLVAALAEKLHRPGAVLFRDDYIAVFGLRAALHQRLVARQDARLDHEVALDLEQIGCVLVADAPILHSLNSVS